MFSATPKMFSTVNRVEVAMIDKLDRQFNTRGISKLAFYVQDDAAMARALAPYIARCTATHYAR